MRDKVTAAFGLLLVLLAAIAADQKTRCYYYQAEVRVSRGPITEPGKVLTTQRALAKVVGVRPAVPDESSRVGSSRSNPVRGPHGDRLQLVALEILTGLHRGELVVTENVLHFRPSANAALCEGTLVDISVEAEAGELAGVIVAKPTARFPTVFAALAGFLAAMILFAGVRGVRIVVSLLVAAVLTVGVMLPALLRGYPPVLVIVLFALALIVATFVLVGEATRKGLAAALGAIGGLLSGLVLALFMSRLLALTGTASTEAIMLQESLPEGQGLSFADLVTAGCVVAVLGIVLDVGISVASGVEKLFQENPAMPRLEAARSGMRIARDIMGTMVLTLVFACLGVKIHVLLLPKAFSISPQQLVNSEAASIEIVRVLCGAIGLLLTGPLTAFAASGLLAGRAPRSRESRAPRLRQTLALAVEAGLAVFLVISIWQSNAIASTWPEDPQHHMLQQLDGMSYDRLVEVGQELMVADRLDEAIIALWEASRRKPQDGVPLRELAYAYTLRSWIAHASVEIEQALPRLEQDSKTHYTAGVIKSWLGQYKESEAHLREALRLDPKNESAREALNQMYGE